MKTKQRNNPKRYCNYQISNTTLDVRHQNTIKSFTDNKESLETKINKRNVLEINLNVLKNKKKIDVSEQDIQNIVIFYEQIQELDAEIDDLTHNKDEIEYFTNTCDILYNYYELLENHTDDSFEVNSDSSKKTIVNYFKETNSDTFQNNNNNSINNISNNRAQLLNHYLRFTDTNYINNYIQNEDSTVCVHCNKNEKDILINEGVICCRNCFTIEHILTDNEKPSYKDPPKEISYFSYKRINHFSEWLNQIQGKETTDIPEDVFDKIMYELNTQRIYNLANVTPLKIREILKKHKINKYYEHIPYILNKITGIPNPHLSTDLEEKLKNMFKEIQVPFLKYSPPNRKNFLSYSYVLHKFIQLLKADEFLKYFPLLKSRDKLHQQEQIWKKICEELEWNFIRSI